MKPDQTKQINTGFVPRPLQNELRRRMKRFNVIVCHRRFGKTLFSLNNQLDKLLRNPNVNPRGAYISPTYGQSKRVAWDALKRYALNIPGSEANEAELRVDYSLNNARQFLLSAENPGSIRGIYLDDCIFDEYAEMNSTVWSEVVRPTLSDRRGGATFIGTPKGRNNFFKLYEYARDSGDPEWHASIYRASDTGLIPQEELDSARRTMTEEEFLQEYECDFNVGNVGAYFAKELSNAEKDGRVGSFPYDPQLPVDTYWDLGINDMAAVWFVQSLRGRHRIVDYYEVCGASIPEVVREVNARGYVLGEWVFPHDAQARDFSTGKSQQQVFYNLGCRPNRIVPRVGTKRESINAARMVMPLCEFDRTKCKKGLEALAGYMRKWNSKNNVFEDAPLHNWASNGADAFQCFAMGVRPDSRDTITLNERRFGVSSILQAVTDYNPFSRGKA